MDPAIVTAARRWIGTPYAHQGAVRGAGCDCVGLLRGVLAEISGSPLVAVPPYTPDWSEPQGDEALLREITQRFRPKARDAAAPGDLVLFRMRQGAVIKHIGIQASIGPNATFIHAYQGHGVRESMLSFPWQRRLAARFSVPDPTQDKV